MAQLFAYFRHRKANVNKTNVHDNAHRILKIVNHVFIVDFDCSSEK